MNRQLLYLLAALVLIVTVPLVLPLPFLSSLSLGTEGFMPPRVAPFALAPPRPAEPHAIMVSDPPVHEAFEGVSSVKPMVEVSDTAYDAMSLKQRSDLLKGVQQMIREEIRTARTHPLDHMMTDSSCSTAVTQGQDYQRRCDKVQDECGGEGEGEDEYRCPKNPDGSCPPVPDLTQYIRKDQIPCWGCAVDY